MPKEELQTRAGKVEISSRWWASAWPKEIPPTSDQKYMTSAIKKFESQKRSRSKTQILITLKEIGTFADALKKDARKAMVSYPTFRASFEKQMDKVIQLAGAQSKLVADTGNKSTVIWKKDLAESVKDQVAKMNGKLAARIDFTKVKRIAELKIPEIVLVELEERNADTQIYRELDKVHQAFGQKCAAEICAGMRGRLQLTNNDLKQIDKVIEKWAGQFEAAVRVIPDKVVASVAIHKSIADKYKRDRAVALARAGTGVAVSGAAIALPGTQGLAIAALVRSCAALSKEIASYAANIHRKTIDLRRYITMLEDAYARTGGRVTAEMSLSLLNGALGIDVLPTLAKAKDDLKDVERNFSLSYTKLQKKQRGITDALRELDKLEKKLQASAVGDFRSSKLAVKIHNVELMLNGQLEVAYKSAKRLNKVESELPQLKARLDAIGKNPTALDVTTKLLKAAGSLAWSISGTIDGASLAAEAEKGAVVFANLMGVMSDVESQLEQFV